MNRMDFQEEWESIVKKGLKRYKKLSRAERIWFNVEPITTGGIWDHYINSSGNHNSDTLEDLRHLGFQNVATLMLKINALFPKGVPKSMRKRNRIISRWPDGIHDDLLDEVESEFWELCDRLESALLEHIVRDVIG